MLDENASLSHRLQNLIRQRFGQNEEKIAAISRIAREILEGDAEPSPPPRDGGQASTTATVVASCRGIFQRIRVEHDVAATVVSGLRTPFGEEISEQLEYGPARCM